MLPFARKVELLRKPRERSGRLIVWFHIKHTPAAMLSAPKGELTMKIAPICGGAYLRMR